MNTHEDGENRSFLGAEEIRWPEFHRVTPFDTVLVSTCESLAQVSRRALEGRSRESGSHVVIQKFTALALSRGLIEVFSTAPLLSRFGNDSASRDQSCKAVLHLDQAITMKYDLAKTMYRHQQSIRRNWLEIEPCYGNGKARRLAATAALRTSGILDDPVDIVNGIIEELNRERIELPAYSTLDRLAEQAHAASDQRLFRRIVHRISAEQREILNNLLTVDFETTLFTISDLQVIS